MQRNVSTGSTFLWDKAKIALSEVAILHSLFGPSTSKFTLGEIENIAVLQSILYYNIGTFWLVIQVHLYNLKIFL